MSFPRIADLNERIARVQEFLAHAHYNHNLMQHTYHETIAMQQLEIENINRSIGAGNAMLEGVRASLVDIMSDVRVLWIQLIGNQQRTVQYWRERLSELVDMRDRETEMV